MLHSATGAPYLTRLQNLRELLLPDYKGPKANFTEAHVMKALVELEQNDSVGRTRLGRLLNLGQGEIRTLIKRLKDAELITITAEGCELTSRGREESSALLKSFPWHSSVEAPELGIGKYCWAIIVREGARKVKKGLEQRDAAIRAGARGTLTLLYSSSKFLIPDEGTDCERATGSREPWAGLRKAGIREGDALIISGADEQLVAEYGAWNAAMSLFPR